MSGFDAQVHVGFDGGLYTVYTTSPDWGWLPAARMRQEPALTYTAWGARRRARRMARGMQRQAASYQRRQALARAADAAVQQAGQPAPPAAR